MVAGSRLRKECPSGWISRLLRRAQTAPHSGVSREDQPLQDPTGKLERDFLQGFVVIGRGVMVLNWKRVDLD